VLNSDSADFTKYESYASYAQLSEILTTVNNLGVDTRFAPTLVRGQGYYTGAIFEVHCDSFGGTVAGGGRYDNLAAKFGVPPTPAVGFSIGFERIFSVLKDKFVPARTKTALLYEPGSIEDAIKYRDELSQNCDVLLAEKKKKLSKQIDSLTQNGYGEVITFPDKKLYKTDNNQ
jgi:histidyl-tRNA synthetase